MNWLRFSNPWQQQPPRRSRLMSRDGRLFIVSEYAMDDPGTIRAFWYPTGLIAHRQFDDFPSDGYPARDERIDAGVYFVETGIGYHGGFRIQLTQGGATKAEHVETREVPPPKVRPGVELSWNSVRGVWMKASKSTKWQPVPA